MCFWIANLTANSTYFSFNSCTAAAVLFFVRLELIFKCNLVKLYYSQRIAAIESSQISPVFPSDKTHAKLKDNSVCTMREVQWNFDTLWFTVRDVLFVSQK